MSGDDEPALLVPVRTLSLEDRLWEMGERQLGEKCLNMNNLEITCFYRLQIITKYV